jgi:hypothetical protein
VVLAQLLQSVIELAAIARYGKGRAEVLAHDMQMSYTGKRLWFSRSSFKRS